MNSTNRLLTSALTLTPPKNKSKPKTKPVTDNDNMVKWANGGVLLMATLSAALNGYANRLCFILVTRTLPGLCVCLLRCVWE